LGMVAVGVVVLGWGFAINHVVGGIIIIIDGIDVGGVVVAVEESGSSEWAGEVVVHCTSTLISMVEISAMLRCHPWCGVVIVGSVIGIVFAAFTVIEAGVGAVYCCGIG